MFRERTFSADDHPHATQVYAVLVVVVSSIDEDVP